jgi:predicted homoserine dehydrogenase-like protein
MNYQTLFAAGRSEPFTAGLIGIGEFGASLIAQTKRIPRLILRAFCDRDMARAVQALEAADTAKDDIARCESPAAALRAFESGKAVVCVDAAILCSLPLDIVVEATGDPESGARNAREALRQGRSVAMVTKEADSVVGPVLAHQARKSGLVYTQVDGDQPSLLMGLVSWARTLGFDIVAAGKSSEYDFVFDEVKETVSWLERSVAVPGFKRLWDKGSRALIDVLAERSQLLEIIPQRTVPDFCEMGVVANATGLRPDTSGFHAPVARTLEVPEALIPKEAGGLLSRRGIVDVFNCLRRTDEASFAGGVFVVVELQDRKTWELLKGKGIPSGGGRYAMIYNPTHLLGVEAPLSILAACALKHASAGDALRPVCDLIGRATKPLQAGQALAIGARHTIDHVEPMLVDAKPASNGNPVPYYMAGGGTLRRAVPAGTIITCDMVAPVQGSALWALRAEQDRVFA